MKRHEFIFHKAALKHINSCFIGAHNPDLKCWHVPNETKDATEAFWNKELGVLSGVSDLQFGWPISKAGVLELKVGKNKLTPNQNKFLSWAHSIGWHVGSAWTVRDVHLVLCSWGLKPAHSIIIEPDYTTKEEKLKLGVSFYERLPSLQKTES